MKTVIVYASTHHGNTKKLLDAIAAKDPELSLLDVVAQKSADLSGYDAVGIASGIAFGKYYPQILAFLEGSLPEGKKVFFLHTAGDPREGQNAAAKAISDARGCECLGTYCCKGFDTFGPFKLVGGIAKGHPTEDEIRAAVDFYDGLGL